MHPLDIEMKKNNGNEYSTSTTRQRKNGNGNGQKRKNIEQVNHEVKHVSNVVLRTIFTIIMLSIILSTIYLDKIYLFIIVYIIETFVYVELIRMVRFPNNSKYISMNILLWYFKGVADFYFVGKNIMRIYPSFFPGFISKKHLFICFTLYIAGIVVFVLNLEKKGLKNQFGTFAISHLTTSGVNVSMCLFMNNINNGIIWFIYPVILVSTNDIFAYIVGKLFGKTPLLKISPKKTWEGFLGGFVFTSIFGLFLCYIKGNYMFFPDSSDTVLLSKKIFTIFYIKVPIKLIYIHGSALILFASLIAPFGGFFASGLKRAFKIKDFGESIPGHGGFADRTDCQILMGVFTNVYYRTFILKNVYSLEKIFELAVKNLNNDEKCKLVDLLNNSILN